MSRINDALKLARQAQAATPPIAAGPALRPLPMRPRPTRRAAPTRPIIVVGAVVLVGIVAAGVAYRTWFHSGTPDLAVRAKPVTAHPDPTPAPPVEAPAPPVLTAARVVEPAPVVESAEAPAESPAPPASDAVATTEPAPATDTPPAPPPVAPPPAAPYESPVVEAPSPAATAFVLQGLFYYPGNPLAIINGQRVSIGSHVGGARVVAMNVQSVTIVTARGQTNVLELSEP